MFGNKMKQVEKAIKKDNTSKLVDLCDNKDQEVCLAAIEGLGSIGGDGAANYLVSHLQSAEPKVRIAIAHALGVLGDIHSKAAVVAQMNKEEDPDVREALSKALTHIKSY